MKGKMGLYLKDAWWNDLPELRGRTDALYEKLGRDIWQVTAEKMIQHRKWIITEAQLIPVLQELGVYYIPKKMIPGPMFVFPQTDVAGHITRAQTRPLHDLFGEGKYHTLGVKKESFLGPVWMGNSDLTLAKVLETKTLGLVEGPFDLIAVKVVAPGLPFMSSLTKSIGEKHEIYLQILGLKHLYLLFDNETSGAGFNSKAMLSRILKIPVEALPECPGGDPSAALEKGTTKNALRKVLSTMEDA